MRRKAGTPGEIARTYDAAKAGQQNKWGITKSMLRYMDLIADLQAERPSSQWVQISQEEIGKRIGVVGNTVAPRLQKLIEAGLLDRHPGNHGMGIPDSYRVGWFHELIAASKIKDPAIETKPVPLSKGDMQRLPAAVALVERFLNSVVSSPG